MKLTLDEMREIAKRLPIGYYLGCNTPVIVEEGNHAYANVVKGDIHIGLGLLQIAADHIKPSDASKWDRETLLRCLLYHEIGHLLLTHAEISHIILYNNLTKTHRRNSRALINIFEDERLETLLSSVFLGVDFKAFCRLINGNKVEHSCEENKFLDAVRLRNTTKEINTKINEAIKSLSHINANEFDEYDDCHKFKNLVSELADLILNEEQKDDDEQDDKQDNQQDKEQNDEQDEEQQSGEGQSDENNKDDEKKDEEDTSNHSTNKGNGDGNENDEGNDEEKALEPKDGDTSNGDEFVGGMALLRAAAKKVFVTPPQDVERVLNRFASRLTKKRGAQASGCWSGLHGRIEPKRDAMDRDKIFRRKSDVGDKLFSSVNLTLWVDNSGSFYGSKEQLNQILAAVSKTVNMVGNKLNVNLVRMGTFAEVMSERNWFVDPDGDNDITESYVDAWKQTRKKDRRNIDIVVFDGFCGNAAFIFKEYSDPKDMDKATKSQCTRLWGKDFFSHTLPYELQIAEKIWNSHDCWIVSDTTNKEYFSKTVPKAHVTYIASDYAKHLQSRVIEILDRIL